MEDRTLDLNQARLKPGNIRRFRLSVVEGTEQSVTWESTTDRCSIGSHPSCDLVIDEPAVSRFHCEVSIGPDGARVRDLGSRNGTTVDGTPVLEAFLRSGSLIKIGRVGVRFEIAEETIPLPLSEAASFGSLVGKSVAMRTLFALLERVAATDSTVLLEGETGTGKDAAAESIHQASSRSNGPLVVVDCGAVPAALLESQLFGHEKGAFTGADSRRTGAFEEADGGTIFLDEIGELPTDLQPKLLRVLERRQIQRVGSNAVQNVDVRVIAATNRDLRAEVNEGRWRSDLYYRLAVVKVRMPALREHLEDVAELVEHFAASLRADPAAAERLTGDEFIAHLKTAAWPGNVRELRNYLERCLVFEQQLPFTDGAADDGADGIVVDVEAPYEEARRKVLAEFERRYVEAQLERHGGSVTKAARAAGIGRVYVYKLLKRHGLR